MASIPTIPLEGSATGVTATDRRAARAALTALSDCNPQLTGSAIATLQSITGEGHGSVVSGDRLTPIAPTDVGASSGEGGDSDSRVAKALTTMSVLRERIAKGEVPATPADQEAVEQAYRSLGEEHLQRHSGGHRRVQDVRAAGGQLH